MDKQERMAIARLMGLLALAVMAWDSLLWALAQSAW